MSEELLPCPFCGGAAEVAQRGGSVWFAVECLDCEAASNLLDTEKEAVAAWNTRKQPPLDTALL